MRLGKPLTCRAPGTLRACQPRTSTTGAAGETLDMPDTWDPEGLSAQDFCDRCGWEGGSNMPVQRCHVALCALQIGTQEQILVLGFILHAARRAGMEPSS